MFSTDSTSPPFESPSSNDRGVAVTIVNVILVIFSGISVFSRSISRWNVTKLYALDDVAIFISFVFLVIQGVCVQLARSNGLGKHRSDLSEHEFLRYSKYNYASELLTTIFLLFAKLATSRLILTIRPLKPVRIASYVLEGIIVVWWSTSLFALAFQCSLPRPWLLGPGRCVDLRGLYYYVGVLNIVTDMALVIVPAFIVRGLQLNKEKKLVVWSLFATRTIVCGLSIAQLACLDPFLDFVRSTNGNQTWEIAYVTLVNQIIINVSFWTACVPSLRKTLMDLQTKQTGLAVTENFEMYYVSGAHGNSAHDQIYVLETKSGLARTQNSGSEKPRIRYGHNLKTLSHNFMTRRTFAGSDGEKMARRNSSQEWLQDRDVIYRTQDYSVHVMDDDRGSTPSMTEIK